MGGSNSSAANVDSVKPTPRSILKKPIGPNYVNGYGPYPPNYIPGNYPYTIYNYPPQGVQQPYVNGQNPTNSSNPQYPVVQDQPIPPDPHHHHHHRHNHSHSSPHRHSHRHHHHHDYSRSPPPARGHRLESPKPVSREIRPRAAQVNFEGPRLAPPDSPPPEKRPVLRDPTPRPAPVVTPRVDVAIHDEKPPVSVEPIKQSARPKTLKPVTPFVSDSAEDFQFAPPIRSTYVPRSPGGDSIHIYGPGTLTVAERTLSPQAKQGKRWYDHDNEKEIKRLSFRDD